MDTLTHAACAMHAQGYNCSQAVACACAQSLGLDTQIVFRMMEGFGLGMGCMECTCGAVSGAVAIAGLVNSAGDVNIRITKPETYALSQKIVQAFEDRFGSVICKDLKGVEVNGVQRSCNDYIIDAIQILTDMGLVSG